MAEELNTESVDVSLAPGETRHISIALVMESGGQSWDLIQHFTLACIRNEGGVATVTLARYGTEVLR